MIMLYSPLQVELRQCQQFTFRIKNTYCSSNARRLLALMTPYLGLFSFLLAMLHSVFTIPILFSCDVSGANGARLLHFPNFPLGARPSNALLPVNTSSMRYLLQHLKPHCLNK